MSHKNGRIMICDIHGLVRVDGPRATFSTKAAATWRSGRPPADGMTRTDWITKNQGAAWAQSACDYVQSRIGDVEITEDMFVDMSKTH